MERKKAFGVVAAGFVASLFMSPLLSSADAQSKYREALIKSLRKNGFIRNATCEQFTNLVLSQVGLPALGQTDPVEGIRGNMDRRGEGDHPPLIKDGTIRSKQPYLEYALGTSSVSSDHWRLALTRIRDIQRVKQKTTSQFEFKIGSANNFPSCELEAIAIETSDPHVTGTYDLNRCLDLFDPMAPAPTSDEVIRGSLEWSCAVGLRYFAHAKFTAH